jgi:mannose-6-phosphate isomerase class I
MASTKKPYLIIPRLIEQPTWGGDYIIKLKNWDKNAELGAKKIGQSYELFNLSKLAISIIDSSDNAFTPDMGNANNDNVLNSSSYIEGQDYIQFNTFASEAEVGFLGPSPSTKPAPLLIKLNHAFGNSFQLHIKPTVTDARWKPKAESWYFMEDGLVTCGVNREKNIEAYKAACHAINNKMKELSQNVLNKTLSLDDAKEQGISFIKEIDPWQYVNVHQVKKHSLLDLSAGAVHHSWEENREILPLGNVIYEVQQDVMDPICTIRGFDQGKFKSDGSIREIHIDDYFKYIDTDPAHNDIEKLFQKQSGNRLLTTSNYCVDLLEVSTEISMMLGNSFDHLFVRDGSVYVSTSEGTIHLTQGHSCIIPYAAKNYSIKSDQPSVLLRTFVE